MPIGDSKVLAKGSVRHTRGTFTQKRLLTIEKFEGEALAPCIVPGCGCEKSNRLKVFEEFDDEQKVLRSQCIRTQPICEKHLVSGLEAALQLLVDPGFLSAFPGTTATCKIRRGERAFTLDHHCRYSTGPLRDALHRVGLWGPLPSESRQMRDDKAAQAKRMKKEQNVAKQQKEHEAAVARKLLQKQRKQEARQKRAERKLARKGSA